MDELTPRKWDFPIAQIVKNLPANAGDARDGSLIPKSRRSSGEGNDNPVQYSCLGNPMDRESWQATVHGVTKGSDTSYRLNKTTNNQGIYVYLVTTEG